MVYARIYNKIHGVAIHKVSGCSLGNIAQTKIKNAEPIGVVIVRLKNLTIWAAFGKWTVIHANNFMLVPISKAEYDTDIAFGLWPKLTLIRYPNWIWRLKKFDWKEVNVSGLGMLLITAMMITAFILLGIFL